MEEAKGPEKLRSTSSIIIITLMILALGAMAVIGFLIMNSQKSSKKELDDQRKLIKVNWNN